MPGHSKRLILQNRTSCVCGRRRKEGINENKNHTDMRFETEEKCSCESRPPSRNQGEGLPEAEADVTFKIMKISWRKETSAKAATVQ